jgi:hypothetical protein
MSASVPGMDGLRTDQAPPIAIWAGFYLLAPLAMAACGWLLWTGGDVMFASRWVPRTMAATHVGTLGFLAAVMLGSLYQLLPVVAGAPVPWVRLAHLVQAALAVGVLALVDGLATGQPARLGLAARVLAGAFLVFVGPVAYALARAPTRSTTVHGMRVAVLGLIAVAALGVVLALARAGELAVRGDWLGLLSAHLALGGVVWLGGLVTAVSWQVVPMFYLTPPVPRWSQWLTLAALVGGLVAVVAIAAAGGPRRDVVRAIAPALLVIWLLHPLVTLRALHRRRRRRVDGSVRFWWAGLSFAPLALALALATELDDDPRWPVAMGWVAVWGWAGLIVHGMLTRIVPFLVWLHRFAPLVGRADVPSMRALLPDRCIQVALGLHVAAVLAGLATTFGGGALAARATAALLIAAGLVLGANLVHTLRQRTAGQDRGPTTGGRTA